MLRGITANINQLIQALIDFDYDEALKEMEENKSSSNQENPSLNDEK
ncbi:hypothetical protein QGM71_10570 [Virgibacillus sp. C22-A2]|uniref:Bacterial mobilisation domain-containing protein n=1 Tax=Virgibacillus tibetensis TaxID=3042313 RepID=A0ABU6KFS8_9BACI|nr:hypothetical protein [Virgibacillus sp. C22-A2]